MRTWLASICVAVLAGLASAGEDTPGPAGQLAAPGLLEVVYFYSPTCEKCQRAERTLDAVERLYQGRIRVVRYSVLDNNGLETMLAYEERHGADPAAPPRAFVGGQVLTGVESIAASLSSTVDQALASHESSPTGGDVPGALVHEGGKPTHGASRVTKRFTSFTAGAVAIAGLTDGVNPCAFTTIVFMLSMLAYLGKGKRELVIVGVTFTFAVFLTYILLGVGILQAVKALAISRGLSRGLTYVVASLTFVLGAWSFFDAFRFARSGEVPKGALGMPKSVKQRVHTVIRRGLKTPSLAAGAFVVGCLVSLLESICTGQVYLPTIMLVVRTTEHRWQALAYLLLYNLMFILPLVVLVGLSYCGVGSQRLGELMKRRLGVVKVALGVLFVGLGVLLLVTA